MLYSNFLASESNLECPGKPSYVSVCVSLQNQTSSLSGFLPLLMGSGAFSALAQGANISPAAVSSQLQPADPRVSVSTKH